MARVNDWSVEVFELRFQKMKRIGLCWCKPHNDYDEGIK